MVDGKSMKVTATYPLGDHGGCNGLALDVKNQILFAACSVIGPPGTQVDPANPSQRVVVLSTKDGNVLKRLPLAGSSDDAVFNRRPWKRSARKATAP